MARTYKAKPDELKKVMNEILQEYGDNVTEGVKAATKAVAKIAMRETKARSPVHKGAYVTKKGTPLKRKGKRKPGTYKKGWRVKEESLNRLQTSAIVHNRTDYQLAHLLEKGHALKRGGRTYGKAKDIVHIEPAEQRAIKNLEEAVRRIAKEG